MAWDPSKHPRGPNGRFIKVATALGLGKGDSGRRLGRTPTSPLSGLAMKMAAKGKRPSEPEVIASKSSGLGKAASKVSSPRSPAKHPATPAGIRAAHADHVRATGAGPREWVNIADIRDRIGGTREEQDRALRQIEQHADVNIVPQANQKALSDRTRHGAVRIGLQLKHFIAVGI